MNQTEKILEFDKIKEIWSALALTDSAKREIQEAAPVLSEVELRAGLRETTEAVIRSNKECMSDSYSVNRSGHLCVPVKKEYKFRVSGSVIDKSSTGNTLFIEPTAVAKYSEELQLMRIDEENEERRISHKRVRLQVAAAELHLDQD